MTAPVSPQQAARLEELWKRIAGILASEDPLPSRIAEAALIATGAQDATVYLKERDAWVRSGPKLSGGVDPGENRVGHPAPLPGHDECQSGELRLE